MPAPDLPKGQDCHELWSKKRRRQLRDMQEAMLNQQQAAGKVMLKTNDSA